MKWVAVLIWCCSRDVKCEYFLLIFDKIQSNQVIISKDLWYFFYKLDILSRTETFDIPGHSAAIFIKENFIPFHPFSPCVACWCYIDFFATPFTTERKAHLVWNEMNTKRWAQNVWGSTRKFKEAIA